MKTFFKILSYVYASLLGVYATSQFKFNEPIEPHRWAITSLVFIICICASNIKKQTIEKL